MKYLKSYKLFESSWYDIKDHLNVLADMSLSLWDRDFNVQVADEIISREHQCVVVNIVKKGSTKFTFPVIKEELLEMVDYMDSEGWEILDIMFVFDMETIILTGKDGYQNCKLEEGELITVDGNRKVNGWIQKLGVKFVEKGEFKTNESFGQNSECLKVLNDICLELSDEDYSFFIDEVKGSGIINPDHIRVGIFRPTYPSNWQHNPFNYDDVKDVFERMIEYMDSEDFEILRFVYSTPEDPASHNFLEYQNGELMTYNREKVDRFHHLQIIFTEKEVKTNESTEEDVHREMMIKKYGEEQVEECDEVIKNISDMLLELEDLGLSTLVGYSPMTIVSIDSNPKISVEIKGPVELFDSNSKLIHNIGDQIKDYVKDYKFVTGSGEWVDNNTWNPSSNKKVYAILLQK